MEKLLDMNTASIKDTFNQINEKRLRPWQGEEEVRFAWMKAIEDSTGLHLNAERGRKDSSLNHVIIEFKAPGFFKGKKSNPKFIEATKERLLPYIIKESQSTGIPASDFIGIAIDGEHICFTQVIGEQINSQHLIPFSEHAVKSVVDAFRFDTRQALTTDNLLTDFGHSSLNARSLMQALSDSLSIELNKTSNNKIKMLFEEWRTLYGQVADISISQTGAIEKEMAFTWTGSSLDSIPARLFVIHTYNSLLIKLIAAEIVSAHKLTTIEFPAQAMSSLQDDKELILTLRDNIENSGIFEDALIKGFVEEAIFSWYLDVENTQQSKSIALSLRSVLSSLSFYRMDKLSHTRDILKDLYQGLVPGKLRQSLGEFYTPDWLVDFTLLKANSKSWLKKRVLDPTCGSGAFLVALIRKKTKEAKKVGLTPQETLEEICSTVWGFDLNPLAVQTARVNFLMEIAELMRACEGISIELPILLADAIYSPAHRPNKKEKVVQYKIGSQVAKLDILLPVELALNRARLDLVFDQMGESVEEDLEFSILEKRLTDYQLVSLDEMELWQESLSHTYNQVLALHRKQWNGIWFRIVRNFFWSATAGQFDYIVGNPPWVRWSKLPALYRERVKPTCEDYGIFSKTKRHGGNELDISAMITYAVADKWLKNNGTLAFILTGTLFKNPSSAGFRTFKIEPKNPNSTYLQAIEINDFKALKPFEDASNHTAVSIFKKSLTEGKYPVPYFLWSSDKNHTRSIPASLNISDVLKRTIATPKEAFPVNELGSPWAILSPGRFTSIKYLSAECSWTKGRKGITTDLNGVFFVPIIQENGILVEIKSRPDAGRKDIGQQKKHWVEPDLLYPLIKGAGDFESCYLKITAPDYKKERLYTFVPNQGISKSAYQSCKNNINSPALTKTKTWFKGYKDLLLDRSTYRRQMNNAPYQAIYNIGDYTLKPWKVMWPEMSSSFYAAVASSDCMPINGKRVFIPDHKVYFSSFDHKEVAYYLCGLLNSDIVREWLDSHNVSIQVSDIFKHLSLPEFDNADHNHLRLYKLVEQAHGTHSKKAREKILATARSLSENILNNWSKK